MFDIIDIHSYSVLEELAANKKAGFTKGNIKWTFLPTIIKLLLILIDYVKFYGLTEQLRKLKNHNGRRKELHNISYL